MWQQLNPVLGEPSAWLFGAGVAALVAVWRARMPPIASNLMLFLGVLCVALSVFIYPGLKTTPSVVRALSAAGTFCALGLLANYTLWVDASRAVLESTAAVSTAGRSAGFSVAGIPWSPRFSELQLTLLNPTKWDYSQIDLVVNPNVPVVAVEQTTSLPDVSVWRNGDPMVHVECLQDGASVAIDLVPVASEHGFRIRCEELPAEAVLEFRMAIAGMAEFPKSETARPREGFMYEPDFVLRWQGANGKSIWYGYETRPDATFVQVSVSSVHLKGSFRVRGRTKPIDETVPAVDIIGRDAPGLKASSS